MHPFRLLRLDPGVRGLLAARCLLYSLHLSAGGRRLEGRLLPCALRRSRGCRLPPRLRLTSCLR